MEQADHDADHKDAQDPEIEYEDAPEIVELSGNEQEPDAATLAQIAWLLRRYTSYAFIARLRDLLAGLAGIYLQWTPDEELIEPATAAAWARTLHDRIQALQTVLDLLERAQPAKAYALLDVVVAGLEPRDARDEMHFSLCFMTQMLGEGAQPWGERAGDVARRIEWTLAGKWCTQTILADRLSLRLRPRRFPGNIRPFPQPHAKTLTVKSGRTTPQSGLWLPTTIRNACPNYLIEGRAAPVLRRACERLDYAATAASGGEPAREAWSDYEYTDEPTVWRLVQADAHRHVHDDKDALLDEEYPLPR